MDGVQIPTCEGGRTDIVSDRRREKIYEKNLVVWVTAEETS